MTKVITEPDELEIGKIYHIDANVGDSVLGVLPGGFVSYPSPSMGYIPFSEWCPKKGPDRKFLHMIPPMAIVLFLGPKKGISFLDCNHDHYKFLHEDKIVYISRELAIRNLYIKCP